MSDVTPKKRPQRPAAPLWAARRRLRSETSEARGAEAARHEAASEAHDAPEGDDGDDGHDAPEPAAPAAAPVPPAPPRPPRPASAAAQPQGAAPRATSAGAKEAPGAPPRASAPATVPPGRLPAIEARKGSNEEPEAVSLRDIETLLTPGKVPPRLPATSARLVGGSRGALPLAKPLGRPAAAEPPGPPRPAFEPMPDAEAVPASSRAGDAHGADLAAMAALVPPRPAAQRGARPAPRPPESPPSTVERSIPNPLEASAADIELMAALAAVPAKKPDANKVPWAPPKPPVQAKAQTVAVLSSGAAAALKGAKPAGAPPAAAPWRPGPPGSLGSPLRSPAPRAPAPSADRASSTDRSSSADRSNGDRPSVVVPPPPVRVGPPKRKSITDAADLDDAWDAGENEPQDEAGDAAPAAEAPALPPVIARAVHEPTAEETAAANLRAVDALAMRAGPRGSLPDPVELLRDAPGARKPASRGSVVDPLELYGAGGAQDPGPPRPPEHTLPKVMVQVPAKSPEIKPPAGATPATPSAGAAKTAAAITSAEVKTAAAIAEAEARTDAAAAEAAQPFRAKVDLPARVEPKPFPKPPPRRAAAPGALGAKAESIAAKTEPIAAKTGTKPAATSHEPKPAAPSHDAKAPSHEPKPAAPSRPQISAAAVKKLDPKSIWDVGPLPDEPLGEDEIQIDLSPDAPETDAADAPRSVDPTSDSGRFDLQQLMSVGPKSGKKGVADTDLFSLAGDLFHDSSPLLAPPDLSRLPTRGASVPPGPSRLLGPVASTATPASAIAAAPAPATERGKRAATGRAFTPWVLLPILAMAVAVILVWRGRSTDQPSGEPITTAGTAPEPATTAGAPVRTAAPDVPAPPTAQVVESGDKPGPTAKPDGSQSGAAAVWKPPAQGASGTPTASAPATTTTSATTATTKTTAAPTATASAPPSGGEFNSGAAKAALRNAAGAAAGCPSDKPGLATVSITFAPSGRVTSSVVSGGFAGTTTGGCIAAAMRGASVPPFEGGPVSVVWKVTLR